MSRRFAHRSLFHLCNAGWHCDNYPRSHPYPAVVHLANEMAQHRLGNLEIGNHPVLQRTHRNNVRRSAAEHALGFVTNCKDAISAGLHRHNRWFT